MSRIKRNNSRHFSTSVCCKANHSNNGQAWPSGFINFIIDLVIKEEFNGNKVMIDYSVLLLYKLGDLLSDYENTKFKSIFFACNKTSGPISMYDIFDQEDFSFTCNVPGLIDLVKFIGETLEKKKLDVTSDKIYLVISLWPDDNNSSSSSGSSGSSGSFGSFGGSSSAEVDVSELKNNNFYMGRQSINIPKRKIRNFSVLASAKCPSNFRDTYLDSRCESSFLYLFRSLVNILFPVSVIYNPGFYNSKFLPRKQKHTKLFISGKDINPRVISCKLNEFIYPYDYYCGAIVVTSVVYPTKPGLEKGFHHYGGYGPLNVCDIIHRTIILSGHRAKDVNICLYFWLDLNPSKVYLRLPKYTDRCDSNSILRAGSRMSLKKHTRSFSTSNKPSFSTLKVNGGEEKIKIVKAYNSNPHKSIVNIISKAKGNMLHRNRNSSGGFISNIKTQMFIKSLTLDEFNLNKNYVRLIGDILNAINKIPKPNFLVCSALNSEISVTKHLTNIYNSSTDMLNVFNARLKKDKTQKVKLESNNYNYIGKPRHYPPANKEWFNSIYVYNNNTIKLLPTTDKVTLKLVKSYFNFYSRKLEKKIRSRRLRIRGRRLSTNRILISRAELKHTNDKVVVTIYVYNRQKEYYFNKIIRIATIENLLPNRIKIKIIKKKSLKIISRVKKQKKIVWKTLGLFYSNKNKADNNKFKNYETSYLKHYITRSLRKEMLSIYLWQLVSFNESKFEKRYLLPITSLVRKVYNKKVEFNLVNLKYLYLNSYIFSETLVTKLRNRSNRLLRVLKTSLLMFKLPFIDRPALYEEIYNRKRKLQNLKIDNTTDNLISLKSNIKSQFSDILERSLLNTDPKDSIHKLKDFKLSRAQNLVYCNYPLFLVNTILKSIRNKSVSGIRLEVAGRLTRRNTAARSLFKLRYKGNIKNMDSSYKGLSAVLLRGYAKSNLQYTKLKSRIRIGSFGLKGWVSSSS